MCFEKDEVAIHNSLSAKQIIESLTLENVKTFLESLGVSDIAEYSEHLICPTICHNALDEAESMKLYYYDANKSFHCYTECSENFNIIELYRRYMSINHYNVSFFEAVEYVRSFLNDPDVAISRTSEPKRVKLNEPKQIDFIDLPAYDPCALDCFIPYYHPLWLRDGITEDAMDKFNIKFALAQNKIVIPHYDIKGQLVGIRARAIEPEDVARGKYRPIYIGDKLYNHQLGFNLYGIYENQKAISLTKRAIIFESEKSVMLSYSYYKEFGTAVATCGSQLNRFQINLLIKKLGVSEIILAFDKEYDNPYSPEGRAYRQKLIDKCKRYEGLATFYYIFDERGWLNKKDSPIDKGQEVFEKLFERKIKVI